MSVNQASVKMASSPRSAAGTLYLVHTLAHASRSLLDDALRHLDLSSLQYTVLSVLARNANLSSSGLSRRFYVTPQTMGELILLLERKGLIERREDPGNRKALLLSLTRLGKAVCAKGDAHVKRIERSIFGALSASELAAMRSMLSSTIATLRADGLDRHDTVQRRVRPVAAGSTNRTPRQGADL